MNESWRDIFKKYIECHEAIDTLRNNCVIDDISQQEIRNNLLDDIIETFKSEVAV